jgi:hypothetical protein
MVFLAAGFLGWKRSGFTSLVGDDETPVAANWRWAIDV